jgi:large subunit ribosomal protein L5
MARLRDKYKNEIAGALAKEFDIKNPMGIPRIEKVVINMGLGEASANAKLLDTAADELKAITGQKPVITKAKKSIAAFKLRQGMAIGTMVTLRGERMYEFLDRLISVALPRVRDFRGISGKAFDGRGNYTLGIREQLIFPEIDFNKVDKTRGMNISIVTTAKDGRTGSLASEGDGNAVQGVAPKVSSSWFLVSSLSEASTERETRNQELET